MNLLFLQGELNMEKQSGKKERLKGKPAETISTECYRALGYEDAKATDRLVRKEQTDSGWLLQGLQVLPQTAEMVMNSADSDWCMKLRDCAYL